MKIVPSGKYFRVLPDSEIEARSLRHHLMGWRQKKNDPWIVAEDNLVNRIVLERDLNSIYSGIVNCAEVDSRLKEYQQSDVRLMQRLKHCLNANPMVLVRPLKLSQPYR